MRLANEGKHYMEIKETDLQTLQSPTEKVHLLKISLDFPTKEKMNRVLQVYSTTYRFIVDNYVKFYNEYFKEQHKKYYVENTKDDGLITFFKRNNKICFNFLVLNKNLSTYCVQNLQDILNNAEVIILNNTLLNVLYKDLIKWNGDIIIKQ